MNYLNAMSAKLYFQTVFKLARAFHSAKKIQLVFIAKRSAFMTEKYFRCLKSSANLAFEKNYFVLLSSMNFAMVSIDWKISFPFLGSANFIP